MLYQVAIAIRSLEVLSHEACSPWIEGPLPSCPPLNYQILGDIYYSLSWPTHTPVFFFNWKVTALQCIVAFCHTTWVSRKYTYGPFLLTLPPIPLQSSFKGTLWAPCWEPNLLHSCIHDKAGPRPRSDWFDQKDRKKCTVYYLHGWWKEEKGFPVKLSSCVIFTNEDFSCRGASEPHER